MKKVYLILIFSLFGIALFFFPFITISVIPELKLKVVDKQGEKIVGAKIIQNWQHFLYESSSHENQEVSDVYGFVVFPERKIKVSPAGVILGFFGEKISIINPHASIEPLSSFRVEGNDSYSKYYRSNQEIPTEIVIYK